MKFILYIATNKNNGNRYVGATRRSLHDRRNEHFADARGGRTSSPFHAAIRKHGEDAFLWRIISEAKSLKDLMRREVNYIARNKPEYNAAPGGDGWGAGRSRPVVCLNNNRRFRSARAAARFYRLTFSRVMQLCQNGGTTGSGLSFRYANSIAVVRRERTEVERERHRQQVLAALGRGQIKIKKRVILVESGEIFDSIADAARQYKINEKEVYFYIERGEPCHGFTFRKLDGDGHQIILPVRRVTRKVLCLTDMIISNSLLEASQRYGVNRAKLTAMCGSEDESYTLSGNRFCFLDQWCPNPE